MKTKYDEAPAFHRLTIDLSQEEFALLKHIADKQERTCSKQAKVILVQSLLTLRQSKPK